jgi:amino acid transporter
MPHVTFDPVELEREVEQLGLDGEEVESDLTRVETRKRLGFCAVAIISFAAVAGGPYGIENAVSAAGALPVLIGSVYLGIAWSTTQALVAAELSTSLPTNGGYISWVIHGLGPVLGYVNAMNCLASSIFNLPLYVVTFASYCQNLDPSLSDGALWGIKIAGLIVGLLINILGLSMVEKASGIFTLIVLTPFVIMPLAAVGYHLPFDWGANLSVSPAWQANLSVFVSTLCWNSLGWVNIGNIASDVHNPKRSFPIGIMVAVVGSCLNYIIPVMIGVAIEPDYTQWNTGYFVTLLNNIAPWLGIFATAGAAFNGLNNFIPQLTTTARALRFMALYKILPIPYLDTNSKRFNTPIVALILQCIFVLVLMAFSFQQLVVMNVLYYNVGLFLQFAAFLRLRYTQPDTPRPYKVPGGIIGAWVTVIVFYTTLLAAFYAAFVSSLEALLILVGSNVVFVIGGFIWKYYGYKPDIIDLVDKMDANGEDASRGVARATRTSNDDESMTSFLGEQAEQDIVQIETSK